MKVLCIFCVVMLLLCACTPVEQASAGTTAPVYTEPAASTAGASVPVETTQAPLPTEETAPAETAAPTVPTEQTKATEPVIDGRGENETPDW